MVGRVEIEKAHWPVILMEQFFKVLVLNNHLGKPPVGLLDERKVATHIVGLAAKTGQPGGVAVADELIEPCRPLDIAGGAVPRQGGAMRSKSSRALSTYRRASISSSGLSRTQRYRLTNRPLKSL